jgi:two-component system, OmpR family, response regulator VicR
MAEKHSITTGEAAKYCGVNLRTISRWIENGMLKAHKLHGNRGDRRIELPTLIQFLKMNSFPIPDGLKLFLRRVLIVDDDLFLAKAIQRTLILKKYETEIAEDGFIAGMLLERFKPSVMTLDLSMPGIGGIEVIKYIRNNPLYSHVGILVVSARPKKELELALQYGADDAIGKPFENNVLVDKIETLLLR